VHHGGKWFKGEHEAIVDGHTFDRVQELLKANITSGRKVKRSESGTLLGGKLFDDKGNRMCPSFSAKNGIRYRFYVSSALLRGRKAAVGSVGRITATEIESAVLAALTMRQQEEDPNGVPASIGEVERVVIGSNRLLITTTSTKGVTQEIKAPWSAKECQSHNGRQHYAAGRAQRGPDPVRRSLPCLDEEPPGRKVRDY
jgi:site-specific DNA recombinase